MSKAAKKPDNVQQLTNVRDEYPPSLQHLLRAVLDMIEPRNMLEESLRSSPGSEHVLLDIDVEGARYVLMRMPASERKTVPLSPRELEIVRMVAQGHQNKIIAVVLNISSWTVCTHLRQIGRASC